MTIDKVLRDITIAGGIALSVNNANAQEVKAQKATEQEFTNILKINDEAINDPYSTVSPGNREDWLHLRPLLESGKVTILIQADPHFPGYCNVGGDGLIGVYDGKHINKKRTIDGKLEKVEFILNLSESDPNKKYLFPCDLEVEVPKPTTPIVPEPTKEDLPFLLFSPGASYVQILTKEDKTYGFGGNLQGGSLSLTVQPSITDWYWGGRFSAYYGSGSNSVDISVPATEGPLAGQLVMLGKNDYSLEQFGIGVGSMFGYMIPFEERFGIGFELEHGIMHDWVTRKFTESSAQYINGNVLEGSNISNHSDNTDAQFYGYVTPGFRIKFPFLCGTFSGGVRTDLNDVEGILSAGIAYCPNQE